MMFFEALPQTQPVAFSGIGALVNYAGFAVSQLNISAIPSVTLINVTHVLPFRLENAKSEGIAPPLFALVFVRLLRSILLCLTYGYRLSILFTFGYFFWFDFWLSTLSLAFPLRLAFGFGLWLCLYLCLRFRLCGFGFCLAFG